jgi:hypothetical protein
MSRTCVSAGSVEHFAALANNAERQGVLLHTASGEVSPFSCYYYTDTSVEISLSLNGLACKENLLLCKSVYSLSNVCEQKVYLEINLVLTFTLQYLQASCIADWFDDISGEI